MRGLALGAGAAVLAAGGVWAFALVRGRGGDEHAIAHLAVKPAHAAPTTRDPAPPNTVAVSGVVLDDRQDPVARAVVVLADARGVETRTTADGEGAWLARVAPGAYRVHARGDGVIAVGPIAPAKLDDDPLSRPPGRADDALAPVLEVAADTPNVELDVVRAAKLAGTVYNDTGDPVANATVRARWLDNGASWPAPIDGTDVGRTDASGAYAVLVPAGRYTVDVAHPSYATTRSMDEPIVAPGGAAEAGALLTHGCQIEGRVIGPDGTAASDGTLTRRDADGRIHSVDGSHGGGDGSFRVTTDDESITLLAWPWGSPPSAPRTFDCSGNGRTYKDVTFAIPANITPDLEGTLVDADGAPVPLAYLEIESLDTPAPHQQERTTAAGAFRVFDAPAGRYRVSGSAPGRGAVSAIVTTPRRGATLALGGTGRIAGTVTGIADGTFAVAFSACADYTRGGANLAASPLVLPVLMPHEPRLVVVRGGRFAIDDAPACLLALVASAGGVSVEQTVQVPPRGTALVELDLGARPDKAVYGIVRGKGDGDGDEPGAPIGDARITARVGDRVIATATTDDDGRYLVHAPSGAQISVDTGEATAHADVGRANVGDEQVDLTIDEP